MKNLCRIFALMFITVITFNSCSDEQSNNNKTETSETDTLNSISKKIADSLTISSSEDTIIKSEKEIKKNVKIYKYICPLGCKEGNSDTKGNCSNCGMELIENPDYITKK